MAAMRRNIATGTARGNRTSHRLVVLRVPVVCRAIDSPPAAVAAPNPLQRSLGSPPPASPKHAVLCEGNRNALLSFHLRATNARRRCMDATGIAWQRQLSGL